MSLVHSGIAESREADKRSGRQVSGSARSTVSLAPFGGNERLIDVYRRWFDVVPAVTDADLERAHRLRYQVYCVENEFEDPAENSGELERDAFDDHAVHSLLIHRPSGLVAGTVRLVLPVPDRLDKSFPLQRTCGDPLMKDPVRFPAGIMGEMSRFCISKRFRRRRGDTRYPDAVDGHAQQKPSLEERRVIPFMAVGLMEALVRMSVENNITYLCAAMEPQLLRLLKRMGVYYDPIGPMVDYHGKRQPCYRHLLTLLNQVREERREIWEILTDDGVYSDALREIENMQR